SAAHCVLTPQEKQTGVILVLMGGAATHFACYKNSVLVETRSIPLGGDCITEVIAKNLNVEHLDAQKIKEKFGSAIPKAEFQDELIPIPDSNSQKKHPIKRAEFEAQMSAGLSLFFSEIRKEIQILQGRYSPLNQIVLTGGGARLDGVLEVMTETVSPTSRLGLAQGFLGPEALVQNPAFSGALGGLTYTSRVSEQGFIKSDRRNWMSRTVEVARDWIFEYL
ncbi:MAG: rod shape-determining protein, partial [Candidatus Omnitrophica bacterium]|nr:rod shape-determining protein [Candidatus Omnitrophota bacterium]